ncbi:unnamed protein product [Ambrosiozyma monospora]|uniref:Unnamed protein product n=1 Tax=Ambrosiozyma monospora TaxID=43982 RepID=A0A9W6Z5Z9_AMBMO|nr:unnamed protein product [Ambrosiozyma monospora]
MFSLGDDLDFEKTSFKMVPGDSNNISTEGFNDNFFYAPANFQSQNLDVSISPQQQPTYPIQQHIQSQQIFSNSQQLQGSHYEQDSIATNALISNTPAFDTLSSSTVNFTNPFY